MSEPTLEGIKCKITVHSCYHSACSGPQDCPIHKGEYHAEYIDALESALAAKEEELRRAREEFEKWRDTMQNALAFLRLGARANPMIALGCLLDDEAWKEHLEGYDARLQARDEAVRREAANELLLTRADLWMALKWLEICCDNKRPDFETIEREVIPTIKERLALRQPRPEGGPKP